MKEPSPARQCKSGELPKEPTPPASPSLEPAQTETSKPPLSIPEPSPKPAEILRQARNASNSRWLPWQDQFLASEAIRLHPFLKARGTPIQEAWDQLAEEMHRDSGQKGTVIDHTGSACRAWFKLIIEAHKVCFKQYSYCFITHLPSYLQKSETWLLQKTGTDEQVDDHIFVSTHYIFSPVN